MFLCITFKDELLPFILDMATDEECIKAIEMAKQMGFEFNKALYTIEADRIILHAHKTDKKPVTRKRLYCYNDKVLLQTDTKYPEEIETTRDLLAYERGIHPSRICVVEI